MTGPNPVAASPAPADVSGGGGRPRPTLRRVRVVRKQWLTPRLVSVTVAGDELRGFTPPPPTSHIKVFLPTQGGPQDELPEFGPTGPVWNEGRRPVMRTYTPRRFDQIAGTLEIHFVIHGAGPASDWAERTVQGDEITVAGPGGRFTLNTEVKQWWIAGDESAVPAVATLLDALTPTTTAEVHLEVSGPEDEIELSTSSAVSVQWHHRSSPSGYGMDLYRAAADAALSTTRYGWVAGEATAVRGIRRQLIARGVPTEAFITRGYWRSGHADHPDHDYGDG